MAGTRWRFAGWIAGAGTTSGTRLVLGHWPESPFGAFADVMVAHPDGSRELLAPTEQVAEFVAGTYRFETVQLVPVTIVRTPEPVGPGQSWEVSAGPLTWSFELGRRHRLGHLLRAIPPTVATSRGWAHLTDPVARLLLGGVRTIGSAGRGRVEWYAGRDLHLIAGSQARWEGTDLGAQAPVHPPPRFGFSGTPRTPCLTTVVSTVVDRVSPGR